MSLYKRGKTWPTDFTVNGKWCGNAWMSPIGTVFASIEKRTAVL
jgi:hypothetical protein